MGFLAKEGIRQARLPLPERNRLAQCNLVIETDEKTSSPSGVRMKGLSAEEDYPVLLHAMSSLPAWGQPALRARAGEAGFGSFFSLPDAALMRTCVSNSQSFQRTSKHF